MHCVLFGVRCSLVFVCRLLFVVCGVLLVDSCRLLLFVACCGVLVCVVCCLLRVV